MTLHTRGALPVAILLAAAPYELPGQAVARTPAQRDSSCSVSANAIASRRTDVRERRINLAIIRERACAKVAVRALSAAWRRGSADELRDLQSVTSQIADLRLADTLFHVARDPGAALDVRMRALFVLATYADPQVEVLSASESPTGKIVVVARTHAYQIAGEMPLTSAERKLIPGRIESVGSSSNSPMLNDAAVTIAKELRLRIVVTEGVQQR